uniref:Uncharacterized protein n=1 Tax=Mycena chlorophos TaxID=658473 RepID=A0ABQ0L4B2_MYCCL|nr:predicted protein [Mycena chlorophos]
MPVQLDRVAHEQQLKVRLHPGQREVRLDFVQLGQADAAATKESEVARETDSWDDLEEGREADVLTGTGLATVASGDGGTKAGMRACQ